MLVEQVLLGLHCYNLTTVLLLSLFDLTYMFKTSSSVNIFLHIWNPLSQPVPACLYIFLVSNYRRKAITPDRGVSRAGPTCIDRLWEDAERGRRTICFKVQWLSTAVSVAATGAIDIWTGTHVTRHAPHLETS